MEALVGLSAPHFDLACIDPRVEAARAALGDYEGRWLILLFYPRDFSFVCPTELVAFSNRLEDFDERGCDILAVSVDTLETHRAWMETPAADGGVSGLRFPIASDVDGEVCQRYGVLDASGAALRGLFIIDPGGVLQYAVVHNMNVGRNTDEVLRVLDGLRAGGLCAAGWTRADGTIDPRLDLDEGRVLGNCRLENRIGSGGFGWVYAAWDLKLDRRVAIKIGRTTAKSTRDAVLREARTAAQIVHPNICSVFSIEEAAGVPTIVMEYLAGGSLVEKLRLGPLVARQAEVITAQIASALAASHAAGVVHGDIKPANILFTSDGVAKIADFGMARSPGLDGQPEDGIGGTPSYLSPERIEGEPLTAASDVFSTGLLIVEMYTGQRAVHGDIGEVLELIRHFDPAPLAAEIPERYRDLWVRMMARNPEDRPTMAQVEALWSK
jgi:alkyl hydroperoxide reductase subunit AhpC